MKKSKVIMRSVSHKLLIDMWCMHKCETCKTKGKVSEGEVMDPICVMASYELSVVCSGRKCGGRGVIENNMVESGSGEMKHQNLRSKDKTYSR